MTSYYVATTGSDSNSGALGFPFLTIQHAASVVIAGDTVFVSSGTYTGGFLTTCAGTSGSPITFISATKWGAKLIPSATSTSSFAWDSRGAYVTIDGFEADGSIDPVSGTKWNVGIGVAGTGSIIQNCHAHHIYNTGTVNGNGGAGILLDSWYGFNDMHALGNVAHHVGPTAGGATDTYHGIYQTATGTIKNNIAYANNCGGGIHLWHDIHNCVVANNTSFGNQHGFLFGGGDYVNTTGPADFCTFANNIAFDNTDIGFDQEGDFGTHNVWTNNLSFQNGTNWRLNGGTHTNDVTADPLFVNYIANGGGDYHLQVSSPCIGAGSASYSPATDYDGVAYANPPAIGAYEYVTAGGGGGGGGGGGSDYTSTLSDSDYAIWLANPSSIRLVLIEAGVSVAGSETTRYLSTGGYVTGATDTPANTAYLPIVSTGIQFTEQISLTNGASLSAGDISISNLAGEYDTWLSDVWVNRPIKAFIGDPRWTRSDFRLIFNGVIADIDSKSRDSLNLLLRDKMQRLNTPLSDVKLGGTSTNKDVLLPLLFGECHNITPLLSDPVTLEYQIHNGPVEYIFEVRDNGKPITVTTHNPTGKFELLSTPAGVITVSAQGDKPTTYSNTISKLVQRIVTGYGKASDQFTTADLDTANLDAFDAAHPQPVGIYSDGRENVISVCQQLASSVGAQLIMTREGLLRIIQISLPPSGTPRVITSSQMMEKTLHPVSRTTVVSAVKLGFVKNWTVQPSLLTSIPPLHKEMFATEWWTATASDSGVQSAYKLNIDPVQQDTMLLCRVDAEPEALRQLDLLKVPRTVYQFEGTADLMTLQLGDPATLVTSRFGMNEGLTGMVVSLSPNWMTGHVTVEVLI